MFSEPEFWVAVAFVILIGVFVYYGIHRTVLKTLDHRADRIRAELDDARRLKDEAAKLLGEYQARRASAEREARDIIESAKAEAERIASEAKTKMEDFVARRTKTAESKIALAEAQAVADVRSAAANAAVTAASTILSQSVKGQVADDLLRPRRGRELRGMIIEMVVHEALQHPLRLAQGVGKAGDGPARRAHLRH